MGIILNKEISLCERDETLMLNAFKQQLLQLKEDEKNNNNNNNNSNTNENKEAKNTSLRG